MASLSELLAGILGGTTPVPPDVAAAVAASAPAPAYDPMTGALIGTDTGRTAPEAAPNRPVRAGGYPVDRRPAVLDPKQISLKGGK